MTEDFVRTRPQLAVSAAVFRGDQILLMRRARAPGQGLYSFPGGRVEFGESLAVALHREVREEAALTIEVIGLAGWREVLPGATAKGHYVVLSFAARWLSGEPVLNDEHDDFQWCSPDALDGIRMTTGLPEIIRAARAVIGV